MTLELIKDAYFNLNVTKKQIDQLQTRLLKHNNTNNFELTNTEVIYINMSFFFLKKKIIIFINKESFERKIR